MKNVQRYKQKANYLHSFVQKAAADTVDRSLLQFHRFLWFFNANRFLFLYSFLTLHLTHSPISARSSVSGSSSQCRITEWLQQQRRLVIPSSSYLLFARTTHPPSFYGFLKLLKTIFLTFQSSNLHLSSTSHQFTAIQSYEETTLFYKYHPLSLCFCHLLWAYLWLWNCCTFQSQSPVSPSPLRYSFKPTSLFDHLFEVPIANFPLITVQWNSWDVYAVLKALCGL